MVVSGWRSPADSQALYFPAHLLESWSRLLIAVLFGSKKNVSLVISSVLHHRQRRDLWYNSNLICKQPGEGEHLALSTEG